MTPAAKPRYRLVRVYDGSADRAAALVVDRRRGLTHTLGELLYIQRFTDAPQQRADAAALRSRIDARLTQELAEASAAAAPLFSVRGQKPGALRALLDSALEPICARYDALLWRKPPERPAWFFDPFLLPPLLHH